MPTGDFLYDVAFSFLGKDEALARRLHDLVAGRVRSFIYSDAERQVKLAGRDGPVVFGRVYAREARTVVVLYRADWGEKGLTIHEATAIRNRGSENWRFVTFIPLDVPPSVPDWLPRTQLWYDLARFGEETAAALIESKVREAGGDVHEESAVERIRRETREHAEESNRAALIDSQRGRGLQTFLQAIHEAVSEIAGASSGHLEVLPLSRYSVRAKRPYDSVELDFTIGRPAFSERPEDGDLRVSVWEGSLREMPDHFPVRVAPLFDRWFTLTMSATDEFGWRELRNPNAPPFFKHGEVADWGVKQFLDALQRRRNAR